MDYGETTRWTTRRLDSVEKQPWFEYVREIGETDGLAVRGTSMLKTSCALRRLRTGFRCHGGEGCHGLVPWSLTL